MHHPGSGSSKPTYAQYRLWDRAECIDELSKRDRDSEHTKEVIADLKQQLELSHEQLSKLKELLSRQDSDVREAQESVFTLMASNASNAEDDDVICAKFKSIRTQWKKFAKEWTAKDLPVWTDENRDVLSQLFQNLVAPDENKAPDGIYTKANRGKAPAIVLNAELGRFIGERVVQRPFIAAYGLSSRDADHHASSSFMRALENVYIEACKGSQCCSLADH